MTGTESFIGGALLNRCKTLGIEVRGIDSMATNNETSRKADIRDPDIADLIPEGATVIHLAAISRDPDCHSNPKAAFDVNVNGTLNVAAAAERRAVSQLIFASSEWVYGNVNNDEVQVEEHPIDVTSMKSEYALSKVVGEQLLRLTCKLPAVTVLRFGIVYGPRLNNWCAVEALFDAVRKEDEITVGAAATARRFIHVNDIVTGLLASRGRSGFEIFNLSGERLITLGEVIETSGNLLGRRPKITETNPSEPNVRNPHNGKAREQLGWRPEIELAPGLKTVSDFLRSSGA